jgi:hypothetical protein
MGNSDSTEYHYEKRGKIKVEQNGHHQTVYDSHFKFNCQGLDHSTRMKMLSDQEEDMKSDLHSVLPTFQREANEAGARCYITYN